MIKNDEEKHNVNKCINFIKEHISIDIFDIIKIDINTKFPYYKINVIYVNKKERTKNLFTEYIVEKENSSILHCFSNNFIKSLYNKENKIKEEKYNLRSIIKIFYYINKWVIISDVENIEKYIKESFTNINDMYEILNKRFYYTYIMKDNKLKFLSKGEINNSKSSYNEMTNDILLDNEHFILINNIPTNNKEICKHDLKCINPKCHLRHSIEYDLGKSYKQYIINEKKKNSKFKSIDCKNTDKLCDKHKYNKCIFIHKNDPII